MNSSTQTNQQDVAVENHSRSRILIFGDSWPFGAELDLTKEKPYGTLIAEYMNWPMSNYSKPATSIDHLPLQLLTAQSKELSLKGCKALFTLTSPSRSMYYEDNEYKEIHLNNGDVISKNYYAYQWSNEMEKYKINLVMLSLQTMCKTLGIKDYYVCGLEPMDFIYPGIDLSKIYDEGRSSLTMLLGVARETPIREFYQIKPNEYIWPNTNNHPNQQGHQLIAEKLQSWIANC